VSAGASAHTVRQLPLGVRLRATCRLDNFVPGPNAPVVDALQAWLGRDLAGHVYLRGGSCTGKSHLLQGCCARAGEDGERVAYLPMEAVASMGHAVLEGMETAAIACVDDVDRVAGDAGWEQALFRFYNEADAAGTRLLFAGRRGPPAFAMADLRSRLAAALALDLVPVDDRQRAAVLRRHAGERGIELGDDAIAYILSRHPRDLTRLVALVEALDGYALAAKRRVTSALVRDFLSRTPGD
jgi:DnaA family protein